MAIELLHNPLIFKLDWSVVGCSGSGGGGVPVLIQLFLYEMLQIEEVTPKQSPWSNEIVMKE